MASLIEVLTGSFKPAQSERPINQVLRSASAQTGVDFEYLLETATRESSLNPALKAKTSSATGLFQFIEQTWLATVKSDGARFGLAKEARQIEQNPDGRFFVRNQDTRQAILDLRKDAEISAQLAGALTQRNAFALSKAIGREPSGGELYIAHFLGAQGAIELLNARQSQPNESAANLFPQAAKANKPIFFEKNGEARSVAEVYAELTKRHDNSNTPRPIAPDPERTLASHTPVDNQSSRILASGPEAAFLAGHFGAGVTAFTANAGSQNTAFGPFLGGYNADGQAQVRAGNAPESQQFAPRRIEDESRQAGTVIPSRYGRIEEPAPSSAPIDNGERTVTITNFEADKADPPLDLSNYRKGSTQK